MQSPSDLGLPYADWRPGQRTAIRTCQFSRTTHTVINAPTGSGKTAIATAVPRLMPDRRHVILTATKALQDQYGGPHPFLVDLRGASNYRCLAAVDEMKAYFPLRRRGSATCDDGPCHIGVACSLKDHGCEYFDAKRSFVAAQCGLTNYSAWLMNRRTFTADTVICDEAHALPEQLMSARGVDVPHYLFQGKTKPRGFRGWRRWAQEQLEQLTKTQDGDDRVKREQLERGLRLLCGIDHTWAWDISDSGYRFEPAIPRLLLPMLQTFTEDSRVIYLSATITPSILDILDVAPKDITFLTLPSRFPVDRRPIYILPGARNDWRSMRDNYNFFKIIDAMDRFCEVRDDRRGLIHSVSFARAEDIYDNSVLQHRMLLHRRSQPVAEFVKSFLEDPRENVIAVSPSVMTGFNFPYRAAEFQCVPKLPFPNTQSHIMKARIRATKRYRDVYTMTNLVQLCGRINRAEDDQGETAIFDEHFAWWYRDNRDLAPEWFDEAIVRTRRPVRPFRRLAS